MPLSIHPQMELAMRRQDSSPANRESIGTASGTMERRVKQAPRERVGREVPAVRPERSPTREIGKPGEKEPKASAAAACSRDVLFGTARLTEFCETADCANTSEPVDSGHS